MVRLGESPTETTTIMLHSAPGLRVGSAETTRMDTPLEAEAMQPTPVVMNTQGDIGDARQKDTENMKTSVVMMLGT